MVLVMAATIKQHEIACQACGAEILFEPLHRTVRCPYCDSPSVIDRPATPDRPDPVFVVGFSVDRHEATNQMRRFVARKKLAPDPTVAADGSVSHGMKGSSSVLTGATWELEVEE